VALAKEPTEYYLYNFRADFIYRHIVESVIPFSACYIVAQPLGASFDVW